MSTENYKLKLHIFGQQLELNCKENVKEEELNKYFKVQKKVQGNGYMMIKASELKCPMSQIQYNLTNKVSE